MYWTLARPVATVEEFVSTSDNLGDDGILRFNNFSSARVDGNTMFRMASTLLMVFSPFSTSLLDALYIQSPTKVRAMPKPCIGWILWLNQTIAIQMTHTRLISEAMEYVTGEVEDKITNAMIFCAKFTEPLMTK